MREIVCALLVSRIQALNVGGGNIFMEIKKEETWENKRSDAKINYPTDTEDI